MTPRPINNHSRRWWHHHKPLLGGCWVHVSPRFPGGSFTALGCMTTVQPTAPSTATTTEKSSCSAQSACQGKCEPTFNPTWTTGSSVRSVNGLLNQSTGCSVPIGSSIDRRGQTCRRGQTERRPGIRTSNFKFAPPRARGTGSCKCLPSTPLHNTPACGGHAGEVDCGTGYWLWGFWNIERGWCGA